LKHAMAELGHAVGKYLGGLYSFILVGKAYLSYSNRPE
jgi:hypothetical protein